MQLKHVFDFQKRDLDWWFFTLLPIILTILVTPIIYSQIKSVNPILILVIQQLLNYSIILSSTDLGLRSKSNREKHQITPPFLIILIALITLVCTYIYYDQIINLYWLKYVSSIVSIIFAYTSILLYNNNPESYTMEPNIFTKAKEESEKKAQEIFESPKKESKFDVKWGEENA